MTTQWVTQPLTEAELIEIRTKLEDGDIPNVEKYAVIQQLIESGLRAARQIERSRQLHQEAADRLKLIREVASS